MSFKFDSMVSAIFFYFFLFVFQIIFDIDFVWNARHQFWFRFISYTVDTLSFIIYLDLDSRTKYNIESKHWLLFFFLAKCEISFHTKKKKSFRFGFRHCRRHDDDDVVSIECLNYRRQEKIVCCFFLCYFRPIATKMVIFFLARKTE